MNTRSLIATGLVCATALTMSVLFTSAGPLSPPAGPIASTNKTLAEVEPRIAVNATNTPGDNDAFTPSLFKITQPGSYYLTGNITGVLGKHGVEIAASDVTLDLNGFTLQGVAGSLDGVFASVLTTTGVVVKNGAVSGWGGDGVDLTLASISTIRHVRAANNGAAGLLVGNDSVVEAGAASGNAESGIVASSSCTIANSTAADNGENGIAASSGAVIVACAARNNSLRGVLAFDGGHVSQCTALANVGDGFSIGSGGVVSACLARNNGGDGIVTTGAGVTISGNTAQSNGDDGIVASSGATILDNAAALNTGDGIQAGSDSLVRGNICNGNGAGAGAGVHITGSGNRVEGNTATGNDAGFAVDGGVVGNLIIKNSASNPVDYSIPIGNTVGPTVTSATIGVDSNPHANYRF